MPADLTPPPSTALPAEPKTIAICAALVVDQAGRMLLVRKRDTTAFMQPGGKPEPGETPLQTIARELAEELGIAVPDQRYDDLGTFAAEAANEPGHRVVGHAFGLTLSEAEASEVAVAAEIDEARWVSVAEAFALPLAPLTEHYFVPLVRR